MDEIGTARCVWLDLPSVLLFFLVIGVRKRVAAGKVTKCWNTDNAMTCGDEDYSCSLSGDFSHVFSNFSYKVGKCHETQIKESMECKATAGSATVKCYCNSGENCNKYDADTWDKKISEAFFLANPDLATTTISSTEVAFFASTVNIIAVSAGGALALAVVCGAIYYFAIHRPKKQTAAAAAPVLSKRKKLAIDVEKGPHAPSTIHSFFGGAAELRIIHLYYGFVDEVLTIRCPPNQQFRFSSSVSASNSIWCNNDTRLRMKNGKDLHLHGNIAGARSNMIVTQTPFSASTMDFVRAVVDRETKVIVSLADAKDMAFLPCVPNPKTNMLDLVIQEGNTTVTITRVKSEGVGMIEASTLTIDIREGAAPATSVTLRHFLVTFWSDVMAFGNRSQFGDLTDQISLMLHKTVVEAGSGMCVVHSRDGTGATGCLALALELCRNVMIDGKGDVDPLKIAKDIQRCRDKVVRTPVEFLIAVLLAMKALSLWEKPAGAKDTIAGFEKEVRELLDGRKPKPKREQAQVRYGREETATMTETEGTAATTGQGSEAATSGMASTRGATTAMASTRGATSLLSMTRGTSEKRKDRRERTSRASSRSEEV